MIPRQLGLGLGLVDLIGGGSIKNGHPNDQVKGKERLGLGLGLGLGLWCLDLQDQPR